MNKWTVPQDQHGTKLIKFLSDNVAAQGSQRALKRAIESNCCKVNGYIERFASYVLRAGDSVTFEFETKNQETRKWESSRILWEDEHVLLYDKPAGLLCDPEALTKASDGLLAVHRLDKETSGVLIFAKSEAVRQKFIAMFSDFQVKKSYLALVDGVPERQKGVEEGFIGKISENGGGPLYGVVAPAKGKPAKTEWNVEKKGRLCAMLKCRPITGRTHQLRVHLKYLGHPILGDYRYRKKFNCPFNAKRCMLHASEISFPHPVTHQQINVRSPLPEDFKRCYREYINR